MDRIEFKRLLKEVREKTGIPFKGTGRGKGAGNAFLSNGTAYLYQPFGYRRHENAVSLMISDTACEVGLYDMFNEHSIYRCDRSEQDLILDIAGHIYWVND